jgi:hypothetical protein
MRKLGTFLCAVEVPAREAQVHLIRLMRTFPNPILVLFQVPPQFLYLENMILK